MELFIDKKFRSARIWSNLELKKFSKSLKGKIVNVSAWKDMDKQSSITKNIFLLLMNISSQIGKVMPKDYKEI